MKQIKSRQLYLPPRHILPLLVLLQVRAIFTPRLLRLLTILRPPFTPILFANGAATEGKLCTHQAFVATRTSGSSIVAVVEEGEGTSSPPFNFILRIT
jgi:hypothetical protein